MELFATLGIDWRYLLWQTVNFAIVVFVLQRYAFRPILAALATRTAAIEQGVRDAEAAKAAREGAEADRATALKKARVEAGKVLAEARAQAEALRADTLAKATAEVDDVVRNGKAALAAEKEAMLASAKAEVADLVVLAAAKVLPRAMTEKDREAMLTEAAKAVTAKA